MWVKIDLRIHQGARKFFDAVGRAPFGNFMGEVFCVVRGNHKAVIVALTRSLIKEFPFLDQEDSA